MLFINIAKADSKKTNVLLILLDDAGYSDVAGFGRDDAPTPNIRQLAQEGVRFTRHYADSTCKPARLALLTGRESARVAQSPDLRGMSPQIVTLADALKAAGYHTVHIGKWHLGDAIRDAWPDKQGFDEWFGFLNQFQLKGPDAHGAFTKRPTYLNPWLQSDHTPLQQYTGHLEDILADQVITHIQQAAKNSDGKQQPWFINYWLFAPHHPSTASDTFLKQFPNTPEGKYRAILAQADAEIGRVIQALRDTKQLDNTLIVLASDNGGTNQMMNNNFPFAGVKGEFREGSLRTPLIIRWPDKREAGKSFDDIVTIQDIYPTVLAAVGVPPTPHIDGQNLQTLLDGKKLTPRTVVHEIASIGLFNYSLLSADGQWRASPNELYNLVSDSSGSNNIATKNPKKLQVLESQFNRWRDNKSRVTLTYKQTNADGQAVLTGDDFRRAPGYGAYSFVIGAMFPTAPLKDSSVIAMQKNLWSLRYNADHTFSIQIGKENLQSAPWKNHDAKQRCVPITLVSYFIRSRLHPTQNKVFIDLFVDNQSVIHWEKDNPAEIDGDFSQPTFIGQDDAGKQLWQGRLYEPLIYDAVLVGDNQMPFNHRSDAEKAACNLQK
jgi:arylsulfatase A-like enzyme